LATASVVGLFIAINAHDHLVKRSSNQLEIGVIKGHCKVGAENKIHRPCPRASLGQPPQHLTAPWVRQRFAPGDDDLAKSGILGFAPRVLLQLNSRKGQPFCERPNMVG
jgi:hypothetical protein